MFFVIILLVGICVCFVFISTSQPRQNHLMASRNVDATVPLDETFVCHECSQPRSFQTSRGLRIHIGKVHKRLETEPRTASGSQVGPLNASVLQNQPLWSRLAKFKAELPVIRRIPRGARISVAQCLATDIGNAVAENSEQAWEHLLTFPYRILHVPHINSDHSSITSKIKRNCVNANAQLVPRSNVALLHSHSNSYSSPSINSIPYHQIEHKLGDGDIRGAARLLFSNDTVAPNNLDTIAALRSKHPPAATNRNLPLPPDTDNDNDNDSFPIVTTEDVIGGISSFQSGSAGGLDALSPQHLKDLVGGTSGSAGESLIVALTNLVNYMLAGSVNSNITDLLYGANLCALKKKDGGIRPIAVGTTYRRLTAKICCRLKRQHLSPYFQPTQLGFGSRGGCEAAVHALRTFLLNNGGDVVLKVDVKNAFNSVDRGAMLTEVKNNIPDLYPFLWQCYGKNSKLVYRNDLLSSEVGCQQGDPLGPAIFGLAIHPIIKRLESKFNVWYLDDGTLGGDADTVFKDLDTLIAEFQTIGLELNFSKCELYISTQCTSKYDIIRQFSALAPNIKIIDNTSLRLLGSPVLNESIPDFVEEKIQNFNAVSDRLTKINMHMAFVIIKFCLFVPKFTYSLRCCQLWNHSELLQKLDNIIKDTLTTILNMSLEDRSWCQASLPIRYGGLGVRKISCVSLPAFLASVKSTEKLIDLILSPSLGKVQISFLTEAMNAWKIACPNTTLPRDPSSQKQWDVPLCELERNFLLETSSTSSERARLLAVSRWESGLWLQALPSSNLGNLLDNNTFRIAISLRIGAPCVVPHRCTCGEKVDSLGHHGLSCSRSAGRIARHSSLNDIIRRAFGSASVAAVLEPNGLLRDDGKRPDGMTLIPWKMGRPLVWDATCVDTLAPSHLPETSKQAGGAAIAAECLKRRKYSSLDRGYLFVPFGVETLGPWGPSAFEIFKDLSGRLKVSLRDQNAGLYFGQKVSLAIQRGNAASILGTLPEIKDRLYYL